MGIEVLLSKIMAWGTYYFGIDTCIMYNFLERISYIVIERSVKINELERERFPGTIKNTPAHHL